MPLRDAPPKADAPPVVDQLDMKATTPVPESINAATVDEFVNNSNAKMGATGAVGHMQTDADEWEAETDAKGQVTKVHMVIKTTIVRPRWAGGHPKPSAQEEALIKKAEQLIKDHEARHRKITEDNMTEAFKQMHGKTGAKAKKIKEDFESKVEKEQKALDAKEGKLMVKHDGPAGAAGPATDVVLGPFP
jgi:hypothetical protein